MLEEQNPWWRGRECIEEDEDYRKWSSAKLKWIPSLFYEIKLEPFSLNFVFGPRQVGKSTLIKLLIKKLLDDGVEPKAVFYYRCDELSDYKELGEVIDEYLKFRRGVRTSYIFLDEATMPREWYRAIKLRIDMGLFRGDVLTLTGSLSMYVKREVETFPGRRGKGGDYVMYPLSFREFLKVRSPDIFKAIKPLDLGSITLDRLSRPWRREVQEAFEDYLKCGGFPLSVRSYLEDGRISEEVTKAYLSWIMGDIAKLGKSEPLVKRILKAVIEKAPSALSWHSLAKELDVGSHRTVFQYVDLLEKLYIAKVLHFYDPSSGSFVFRKEKKVHVTDPFLYYVLSRWCLTSRPQDPVLAESVAASHLARLYDVGYWRNGSEVDIVVDLGREALGFEVKYGKRPKLSKLIVGKMRRLFNLTLETFSESPPAAPLSLFLAHLHV